MITSEYNYLLRFVLQKVLNEVCLVKGYNVRVLIEACLAKYYNNKLLIEVCFAKGFNNRTLMRFVLRKATVIGYPMRVKLTVSPYTLFPVDTPLSGLIFFILAIAISHN